MQPSSLPPAYIHFLNHHGGRHISLRAATQVPNIPDRCPKTRFKMSLHERRQGFPAAVAVAVPYGLPTNVDSIWQACRHCMHGSPALQQIGNPIQECYHSHAPTAFCSFTRVTFVASQVAAMGGLQELARNNALGLAPRRLPQLHGTPHADFCERTPCSYLHPGHNCTTSMVAFLPQAYLRALPVYAPVYIIPAILVHRLRLLKVSVPPPVLIRLFLTFQNAGMTIR